jgi:integrase
VTRSRLSRDYESVRISWGARSRTISYFLLASETRLIPRDHRKRGAQHGERSLRAAAKAAGRKAASEALERDKGIGGAKAAWTRAARPLKGLRFHDLRHQAITELAETGTADATLMAVAGHLSRQMMEHYSHVRMAAKRAALDRLAGGLMKPSPEDAEPRSEHVN